MYTEIPDSLYTGNLKRISTYKITKVKFAKLQIGYGVVFNIDDSFNCMFPAGFSSNYDFLEAIALLEKQEKRCS